MKNRRKKMRLKDHKACQKIHTKIRLRERYGLDISSKDYREMVQIIRRNEAVFVGRQSRTRTYWLLEYNNQKIIAVYRKTTRAIATVLPYEDFQDELFTSEL